MNGLSRGDLQLSASVERCDLTNRNQHVGCRRFADLASLKLLSQPFSFFVDNLEDSWDRLQMGGG